MGSRADTNRVINMIRKEVRSTNIRSVGYDPESNTLEIEFHSGSVYQYYNVPQTIYDELMRASSHGSYFHKHIRTKYKWTKA